MSGADRSSDETRSEDARVDPLIGGLHRGGEPAGGRGASGPTRPRESSFALKWRILIAAVTLVALLWLVIVQAY